MLDALIRLSLNHRLFVLMGATALMLYGALSFQRLPIDIFPDVTKPTVTIMTEAHGMAPEEVETRVTMPIEMNLNGLPGLDRLRSQSGIGLSVVFVEFAWGTDIYRARQLVQEKLNLAQGRLPRDVVPTLGPVGSLMGQIQQIAVYAKDPARPVDPLALRDLAEWRLRPRLLMIPGIAQVISIGGGLKQYQIQISAEKLNRFQLTVDQLDGKLRTLSQNTTGGFVEKEGREYLVRNIGVVESVDDIRTTLVGLHFGRPVLVSDIAEVREAPRLKRGDGSFNAQPSVVMTVQKQPGADTVRISRDIEKAIAELRPSLPAEVEINPDVFRQADFIETSIAGIQGKLKIGSVLVFAILLVFLANIKLSLITLTAIPLSFVVTAIVFHFLGLSVNTMTLGGLAIAIGELVDDAIVDAENVFRRLRENAALAAPRPRLRVIFEASSEVRNSIVLATVIVALVFLPLLALDGLEGRLFTPLAIAYLTALAASLVVSLTLTPVLCYYLLRPAGGPAHGDTRFVTALKAAHARVLDWSLTRPALVSGGALALFVASLGLIPFMGVDFLPKFNEGSAMVSLAAVPGVSLTESNRMGLEAERLLLEVPEVKSVSRRTGRAELDEHAMGVNVSEMDIDFHPEGRPREQVFEEMRARLKEAFPQAGVNVGQPVSHLIDHMLSGVSAAIAIKIFGPDLAVLREHAAALEEAVRDVPGLVDLKTESQGLVPQLKIHVLREEAAQFGLSPGEITRLLEAAFNGEVLTQVLQDTRAYDVFFQFDATSRASLEAMQKTVLKVMPDGRRVRVEEVADVYESQGPNEISRENNQRRIVVSANVQGRDLGAVIGDIQARVGERLKLPEGYYVVYGGQFESQRQASRNIFLYGLVALFGVAFVLYAHFRSKVITAQIMVTLPLAFIGGVVALYFTDRSFTVASLVGFITLAGIASRNSIMMISHYLHLMEFEGEDFSRAMVVRGSRERLVPVLMTAAVAGLALLPLVFAAGQPGSEILHPVAVVIVGGLLTSTLLDIFVTPALFLKWGGGAARRYLEKTKNEITL